MNLRVNYIGKRLRAQGPGTRYTIWVQGCSIHCPGCMNTDTWDPSGGKDYDVQELARDILSTEGIDGVTITGGEPIDQLEAVRELCGLIYEKVCVFLTTGYYFFAVSNTGELWVNSIAPVTDILCVGPFEADKICSDGWRGSSNQKVLYLTERGKSQKDYPVISMEVIVSSNGCSIETGFHHVFQSKIV